MSSVGEVKDQGHHRDRLDDSDYDDGGLENAFVATGRFSRHELPPLSRALMESLSFAKRFERRTRACLPLCADARLPVAPAYFVPHDAVDEVLRGGLLRTVPDYPK